MTTKDTQIQPVDEYLAHLTIHTQTRGGHRPPTDVEASNLIGLILRAASSQPGVLRPQSQQLKGQS